MENLKLNHAKTEINLLTKQLENGKREYGELLISMGEKEKQMTELTHERNDLHHQVTAAIETKQQDDAKIRDLEIQNQILKKQNQQLSAENVELQAKRKEEEIEGLKNRIAELEKEKLEKEEEVSRVTIRNDKLAGDLSVVIDIAADRLKGLGNRVLELELDEEARRIPAASPQNLGDQTTSAAMLGTIDLCSSDEDDAKQSSLKRKLHSSSNA